MRTMHILSRTTYTKLAHATSHSIVIDCCNLARFLPSPVAPLAVKISNIPADRAQNPTSSLSDLQRLLVTGLTQSDFQPPPGGEWTIPRPPPATSADGAVDDGLTDDVGTVGGQITVASAGPDRLQLTTFRPNLDIASLVATLSEQESAEQEEDEEEEVEVELKESPLQALLHPLDRSEFRGPPAGGQAWDIRTAAKQFRDQQQANKVSYFTFKVYIKLALYYKVR